MSFTETLPSPTKSKRGNYTTNTILLTPTKRKRLSSEASLSSLDSDDRVAGPSGTNTPERTPRAPKTTTINIGRDGRAKKDDEASEGVHTSMELYQWTFTKAGRAPCFANDILAMKVDDHNNDMYWLGGVPCRTVKLVGIVVGIDNFEDMTRLKVDDGTAVVDCDCKHPKALKVPSTPKTKRHKPSVSKSKPTSKETIPAKYQMPENLKPRPPASKKETSAFPAQPVFPHVDVGMIVRVIGRVMIGRGSRFLRVEPGNLTTCISPNEEPQHWLEVTRLHRESYFSTRPFIIPAVESQQPRSPISSASISQTASPSRSSSAAPSSPVSGSSPAKSSSGRDNATPKKPRLRHPSKLRTRDLTDTTFRIYLKHYMDFAPPYLPGTPVSDGGPPIYERCITPTPSNRTDQNSDLETPRPLHRAHRKLSATLGDAHDDGDEDEDDDFENNCYGFTLSYLRRVPVLAEMARGVVRAERKRREREARQRETAKANSQAARSAPGCIASSSKSAISSKFTSSGANKNQTTSEPTSKKIKRLFTKTIRDLYMDGSIVLWTGPVRHWSQASGEEGDEDNLGGSSGLWKTSTSIGVNDLSLSTAASSISSRGRHQTQTQTQTQDANDSSAELSEPSAKEEAYISVNSRTMSPIVMRAIRTLSASSSAAKASNRVTTVAGTSKGRPTGRSPRPPTASEILAYLHALDMRWERVGPWVIEDTLQSLKRDDRIFQIRDGRWALCV